MSQPDQRSKRDQMAEAAAVKVARAAADLAMERLTPRVAVAVANAVLRDQLDRLSDAEVRARRRG